MKHPQSPTFSSWRRRVTGGQQNKKENDKGKKVDKYTINELKEAGYLDENWFIQDLSNFTCEIDIVKILKDENIKNFKRVSSGAIYDHSTAVKKYKKIGSSIWGDGDIRLLIKK